MEDILVYVIMSGERRCVRFLELHAASAIMDELTVGRSLD